MLRNAGYPPELGAPASSSATSGYQQQVQQNSVASTIDPAFGNIASMISTLLSLKDTGIKTIGRKVTFRNFAATDAIGPAPRSVMEEITIDPEDIVDVDRSVTFDSLTQFARQAKIQLYEELLNNGHATEDEFLREGRGIDDPIRWRKQRVIEKAQTIGEEAGLKIAAEKLKELVQPIGNEAMAQQGLTPFAQNGAPQGAPSPPSAPPSGGIYTNGGGGPVPLAPAPPADAALGATAQAGAG
jgi:hypothetical protein